MCLLRGDRATKITEVPTGSSRNEGRKAKRVNLPRSLRAKEQPHVDRHLPNIDEVHDEFFWLHASRSALNFRDWAAKTTNVADATLELALAHTIPNKAEAAYRRQDQLEKRAKLMQQWQQHVESKLAPNTPVVQLKVGK